MQENYIFYNRKSVSKNGCDLSEDFIIPDYINDIKKIIHCKYILKENNSYDKGDDVIYEGEVVYELLLLCEDESIMSTVFSNDYSVKVPLGDFKGDYEGEVNIENQNSRLLSARKISVRSRVCISLFSKECTELSPIPSTPTNDTELVNIEKKYNEINNSTRVTIKESSLISSYQIELPSQMPEIENVIYTSISPKINDIKYQDNKFIVRGDCYIHILFASSDGEYLTVTRILDFSDFVDTEYNDPKSSVGIVKIKDIKISVEGNTFGENRNLNIDYTYDIIINASADNNITAVADMYSTLSNTKLEYRELEYTTQKDSIITSFSFDYSEPVKEKASKVVDSYAYVDGYEVSYDGARSKAVFSGNAYADIITQNDTENYSYDVSHIKIPFSYERDISQISGELETKTDITIVCCEVDISNSSFDINIEFGLMSIIFDKQKTDIVESFTLTDFSSNNHSPLVIYYPVKDDDLWSVAKKYRCTSDDIIAVNNLDGNSIADSKVLLIPKSSKRKVFEKVI